MIIGIVVELPPPDSESYTLGFHSGSVAAAASTACNDDAELVKQAVIHYYRIHYSVLVERNSFVCGWVDGYKAYFNGIVSEREVRAHGNQASGQ